jgi:dihydrolipoamide dehydrogenase
MKETQLAVIGGGPGGYPAAFRAADLGMQVTMVDREENPGGVCLYRGCIPSKALLHAAGLLRETEEAEAIGLSFQRPEIDLDRMRQWKNRVVERLTGGLAQLRQGRKIDFLRGRASFVDAHTLEIDLADGGSETLRFEKAILATGSRPTAIPAFEIGSDRVMDSTGALELPEIPESLLVVGGGYIGLELGSVYASLGSRVSVVEMLDVLLAGADRDLVRPLERRLKKQFESIRTNTKVASMREDGDEIVVSLEGEDGSTEEQSFGRVLVSIGRRPNSENLGLENTKVEIDGSGFVVTDETCATAEPSILAVGDVAGQPLLAHKATHEGLVAARIAAGKKAAFEPNGIPAVVFTDPEIAWVGLTESEAKEKNLPVKAAKFPWGASGRAMTLERNEGLTKLIVDEETGRVLGAGLCGVGAGELISECALAIEMGATAEDLALTIHPHPTLSETIMEAAEAFGGHCVHSLR